MQARVVAEKPGDRPSTRSPPRGRPARPSRRRAVGPKVSWSRTWLELCASWARTQPTSVRRRGTAYRSVGIGGSERQVALAAKAPVDPAGAGDAAHLPAEFALQRRNPGHELEAEPIVDHGEAA